MRLFSTTLVLVFCSTLLWGQAARRAPGVSLPDSQNNQQDLADYRGKVVLIDMMKTNCDHCGPFAQLLEQVKAHYAGKVVVLSIAPAPDNPTTVAQFVAQNKITFPILFDCGQVIYSYVKPSPMNPAVSFPHLYIVGPDGFIVKDYVLSGDTVDIFKGKGLYTELDRILAPKKK